MEVIKTISLSLMLSAIPQLLMAQDTFGEMIYSKVKTLFKLNAPTTVNLDGMTGATTQIDKKNPVKIHIYEDGQGGKAIKTIKMKATGENRWETTVKGDLKGKFYTFDIGKGETPGVFAKAVGVNGMRGAIVDMAETNPQGWENDQRPVIQSPADLVIYEMHWRDFSIDVSSGLKNKGKFLALTEPKAIEHLKSLGVNAVHILPSFDYASVDETKLDTPQYLSLIHI